VTAEGLLLADHVAKRLMPFVTTWSSFDVRLGSIDAIQLVYTGVGGPATLVSAAIDIHESDGQDRAHVGGIRSPRPSARRWTVSCDPSPTKRRWRPATWLACAGLASVFSIGSVAVAGASSTSSTPQPGLVLSCGSNGQHFSVITGEIIEVRFIRSAPNCGDLDWTEATSDNSGVVKRTSSHADPNGDAVAYFLARTGGSATLDAEATPACSPAQQSHGCPMFILVWRASITVQPIYAG
jgi:hypothetical protein